MVIICFERSQILDYPVYLHSETYIKLRLASQGAKLLTSIDGQDNHNNIPSSGLSKVLVASDVGSYLKLGGQVVMCVWGGGKRVICQNLDGKLPHHWPLISYVPGRKVSCIGSLADSIYGK